MTEFKDVRVGPAFDNTLDLLRWERDHVTRGVDSTGQSLHPAFVARRIAELNREIEILEDAAYIPEGLMSAYMRDPANYKTLTDSLKHPGKYNWDFDTQRLVPNPKYIPKVEATE